MADSGQILQCLRTLKTPKLVSNRKLVGLVILGGENHIWVRKIVLKGVVS